MNNMMVEYKRFSWTYLRFYLLAVPLITAVITLLEFNPNLKEWGLEALRNLVLTICITGLMYLLSELLYLNQIRFRLLFILKLLIVYSVSGSLGGLAAYYLNDWLFGFNVTHPGYFVILTSSLAFIFGITLISYASISERLKSTVRQLLEKEILEERLRAYKIQAELEALRAKVNPHFFFNTLNSIASLISSNPAEAERLIERLSRLFRYALDSSNVDLVELSQEIDLVREYLTVEKIRLGDRFDFTIQLNVSFTNVMVPGMLLQPLVENSIKHGMANRSKGGLIQIVCNEDEQTIQLMIQDNGEGFDSSRIDSGFGLSGVRERLSLLYPGNHSFEIESDAGSIIRIRIPKTIKEN